MGKCQSIELKGKGYRDLPSWYHKAGDDTVASQIEVQFPLYPTGHIAVDSHFHIEWELRQGQEAALDILPGGAVHSPSTSPAICLPSQKLKS